MQKKMITLLAAAGLAAVSGAAYAQTTLPAGLNAGNTTMAAELVDPTNGSPAPTVNTAYQTGGPIATSTVLKVSLDNATFAAGGTWALCDPLGAAVTTTAAPADGDKTLNVTVTTPLASGTVYTLQDDGCALANAPVSTILVAKTAKAGDSVALNIDSVTKPGDETVKASAVVVQLLNQFSAAPTATTGTIDFTTNMKSFKTTTNVTPTSATSFISILSNEAIKQKVFTGVTAGACDGTLTADDLATVNLTGTFPTPVDATAPFTVQFDGGPVVDVDAAAITAGKVTVTAPGDGLKICDAAAPAADLTNTANQNPLVFTVDGSTILTAGSYNADLTISSNGPASALAQNYSRQLFAATKILEFKFDATQYYAPYVKFRTDDAGLTQTYFKLLSKSRAAGSNGLSATVVCSDGTTKVANLTPLTPGQTATVTGGDIVTALGGACTVDGAKGFGVILNVNAPEADVFAYAVITDANGHKRLPLKSVGGVIKE